jgi:Holliday junction resolvase
MTRLSRRKGATGERQVRDMIRARGFSARRAGRYGLADVIHGLPSFGGAGYHIEVKRRETISMPAWIRQAEADAAEEGLVPLVVWRRSFEDWRVDMPFDEFLRVLELLAACMQLEAGES